MDYERYLGLRGLTDAAEHKRPTVKYPFTEVIEKEGKGGNPSVIIQRGAASLAIDQENRFGEYAIVTRDRVNAKGENESTYLEIQSTAMQKALHGIIGKRTRLGVLADPIVFRKPYYSLFHYRKEIKALAADESNTPEDKLHLEWMMSFMSERLEGLEKIQDTQVDNGLIEFKFLPIIFEVGSIVVGYAGKNTAKLDKVEKLEKTQYPECFLFGEISDEKEDKIKGGKYMDVEVFRWGYNGSMFGLMAETLRIVEFPGLRKITDLECYPWAFMEDKVKKDLFPKLVARGEKWCSYLEAKSFSYEGIAQVPQRATWTWDVKVLPKNMPGRVVLDYPAFMEAFPEFNSPLYNKSSKLGETPQGLGEGSPPPIGVWEISSGETISQDGLWGTFKMDGYIPTPAQSLLCPAASHGYSLEQKDWGFFDVTRLKELKWETNRIGELEIDLRRKEMLRDLIVEHGSGTTADGIPLGKGDGLIFLLYGPPGCGKTLTAELLAEEEKRPLLRISCSDLGQYPSEVDRSLQALLKLALRCSAIVLIDEADAFLAKRVVGSNRDYFHNAIVSIFLKYLEYFPGVVFLTTNQRTEFDEAVSSRVVCLHYGALDAKSRANVWKNHLLKGSKSEDRTAIESICKELGKEYTLDGREIKTLARISLTLCRRRNQRISKEIIQEMYDLTHKEYAA